MEVGGGPSGGTRTWVHTPLDPQPNATRHNDVFICFCVCFVCIAGAAETPPIGGREPLAATAGGFVSAIGVIQHFKQLTKNQNTWLR